MKNYQFSVILILFLIIGSSFTLTYTNSASYVLTDYKGRFIINFPSKPEFKTKTFREQNINYVANIYTLHNSKGTYIISYMDYQQGYVTKYTTDEILDSERDASIKKSFSTLFQEKVIKIKNYPGREISARQIIENTEIATRNRIYIVGNRKYNILTVTYPKNIYDNEIEAFLNSFKLIP